MFVQFIQPPRGRGNIRIANGVPPTFHRGGDFSQETHGTFPSIFVQCPLPTSYIFHPPGTRNICPSVHPQVAYPPCLTKGCRSQGKISQESRLFSVESTGFQDFFSFLGDSGSTLVFQSFVQAYRLTMVSPASQVGVYKVFFFLFQYPACCSSQAGPLTPTKGGWISDRP